VNVYRVADMTKKGRKAVCGWLRKLANDLEKEPDAFAKRFRARYLYVAMILAVALAGVAMAGDSAEIAPGGIELRPASDGTPMFVVDIGSFDRKALAKKRWYAKPGEVLRQVGSNTAENVTTHPGKWFSAGVLGYLVASGEGEKLLESLFGGDDKPKSDPANPAVPQVPANPYAETPPQYLIVGDENQATAPGAAGPVVMIGDNNQFDATPVPATSAP
jgi:hypothetical protein